MHQIPCKSAEMQSRLPYHHRVKFKRNRLLVLALRRRAEDGGLGNPLVHLHKEEIKLGSHIGTEIRSVDSLELNGSPQKKGCRGALQSQQRKSQHWNNCPTESSPKCGQHKPSRPLELPPCLLPWPCLGGLQRWDGDWEKGKQKTCVPSPTTGCCARLDLCFG